MKLILINCKEEYAVREIINAYLPKQKIYIQHSLAYTPLLCENATIVEIIFKGNEYTYICHLFLNGEYEKHLYTSDKYNKTHIKRVVSACYNKLTGIHLPWGLLTGIRPSKNVRELYDSGMDYDAVKQHFMSFYMADESKTDLSIEVAKTQRDIIKSIKDNSVSIYIGIPFCPTRCLYCSFTSQSIKFSNKLTEPYMDALIKEIEFTGKVLKEKNKIIDTIYIGGGTPTALNDSQLKRLMMAIDANFDLSYLREYTVEAGRPDTITKDKLDILKNHKVSRISINPQTMHQKTLDLIGRCHTPEDIEITYKMARDAGFNHINMDLISGLPDETNEDFLYTLEQIEKMAPDSITVHTMSIKHGSFLDKDYSTYTKTSQDTVNKMLEDASALMQKLGKKPYYLYRQKNMLGNLENVGYADKNSHCLYNIFIMEEVQSIIALGAGASTKIITDKSIERAFNVKEVIEYIKRIDEMLERKVLLFKETGF